MEFLRIINRRHSSGVETAFISIWDSGVDKTVQFPVSNLYTIDWGDGNITTTETSHVYATEDTYIIKIDEPVTDFKFNNGGDKLKIKNVSNWGGSTLDNNSFNGCNNATFTATDSPITSTNLTSSFRSCTVFNQPLILDCSAVTNMGTMFHSCTNLNQLIILNNSSLVTTTQWMFFNCTNFNQPLTLDADSITTLYGMFENCSSLNGLITLNNSSSVNSMYNMFKNCTNYNQPLTLDALSVTTTGYMFNNCSSLNSLITLNNSSLVTNMTYMFSDCTNFNQPLTLDCSSVTSLRAMFINCSSLNSLITLNNTSLVTNLWGTFSKCTNFNQPLSLDTSSVTNMEWTFQNCTSFDQDISGFDFSSVTIMSNFMVGKSAANYSTTNMDSLLNRLDDATFGFNFANQTNVNIDFGSINYTVAGETALLSLIAKGFVIAIGSKV